MSGRGQSLTGLERVLFGVLVGGCTSGIADAKSQLGVAKATPGVPVLVCNVASNFTLEGYLYGNKTDVLGTPIGIAPVIETKKDPKGISQWGTKPTYYVSRRVPVGNGVISRRVLPSSYR